MSVADNCEHSSYLNGLRRAKRICQERADRITNCESPTGVAIDSICRDEAGKLAKAIQELITEDENQDA